MRRRFWLGLLALLTCVLSSAPAFADGRWVRAESEHFIVYSDAHERVVRNTVQSLEKFDEVLRRLMRPAESEVEVNKLEVYLFRNGRAITELSGGGMGRTVRGFYIARTEIVGAFAIFRDTDGLEAEDVLFHEYAHHFMMQYFDNAYPRWFIEGFAEFVQSVEFDNEGRALIGGITPNRAAWLVTARWLPTAHVLDSNNRDFDNEDTALFYAQSWLITHFVIANQTPGFTDYIANLRQGQAPLPAFEAAFGRNAEQFHDEIRQYSRRAIPRFAMEMRERSPSELTVTRLPEAWDDLMIPALRARLGPNEAEKVELTAQIERGAAAFPADPLSLRMRAHAALWRNDFAGAREALAPLIAEDTTDVYALYLAGSAHLAEAQASERDGRGDEALASARAARSMFGRAFRLDANHVPTLYRYVETYRIGQQALPSTAIDVLISAHLHAPQVDEIAINTAIVLMTESLYDEAANILRPIANNPHRDPNDTQLASLLAAAEAHRPPSLEEARAAE